MLLKFHLYISIKKLHWIIIFRNIFTSDSQYGILLLLFLCLEEEPSLKLCSIWFVKERINILTIIVSIIKSVKMLLELLKLPFYFINFKTTNVPLEFLHTMSTNNHGYKSKALILTWYRDDMKIVKWQINHINDNFRSPL